MNYPLRIGITDCGKYDNYRRWIESVPGVEAVKLSMYLQNAADVASCDGILFSGGEDVHPALYGRPEYVEEFGLDEIIPARDSFEYQVIGEALGGRKPVLGICRGLQVINVFLGGTLVPDIPSLFQTSVNGKLNGRDQLHEIQVEPDSLLYRVAHRTGGTVNSAHHQSADRPAPDLKVSAYSDPGIVEAMEWASGADKNWLLLVQWHPERMDDSDSVFAKFLREAFLAACLQAQNKAGL